MNRDLLGIVVCGGQSKRMGTDKGLLIKEGKTWSELVFQKLNELSIPVVVSINPSQEDAYTKIFPQATLIKDQYGIGGPINGLLSVHHHYPKKDLLLLACDMIDMQKEVLVQLIESYQLSQNYDFYAYKVENVLQPFCAIYSVAVLDQLNKKHLQDPLAKISLRYAVENGNVLKLATNNIQSFANYNTLSHPI